MEEVDFLKAYNLSKLETCHKILCDDLKEDGLTDSQLDKIQRARTAIFSVLDSLNENLLSRILE